MVWDRGKAAAASPASLAASAAAEGSRLDLVPSCRGPKAGMALLLRMCSALILSTSAAAATGAAAGAAGGSADTCTGVFSTGDAGRTPAAVCVMSAGLCLQRVLIYAYIPALHELFGIISASQCLLSKINVMMRQVHGQCVSPMVHAAARLLCLGIQLSQDDSHSQDVTVLSSAV